MMQVADVALHKKMKFSIKDFSSKCDQIRRKLRICLRIWSHLLEKSLMENFIFSAVRVKWVTLEEGAMQINDIHFQRMQNFDLAIYQEKYTYECLPGVH